MNLEQQLSQAIGFDIGTEKASKHIKDAMANSEIAKLNARFTEEALSIQRELILEQKKYIDRLTQENQRLREALINQIDCPDAFCSSENKTVTQQSIELLTELKGGEYE